MPNGDPQLPPGFDDSDVVLTEAGALPRDVFEARQAAETAAEVVPVEDLLEQRRRAIVAETADAPVQTFVERAVGAGTFGLFDLVADEEAQIERARRIEASPRAALAGTIAGAVVPSIVAPGAGTAGTIARLTPAGKLASASGRVASRGGLLNPAKGAAIEAMVGAGGDYVSRVSLDQDAEFSAEALVGSALKGAALGAVLGGAAEIGARGLGALARRGVQPAKAAKVGKLADDLPPPITDPSTPALITGAKAPVKWTRYKNVVRKKVADDSADSLRSLGSRVDDVAARGIRREIDDISTSARFAEAADDSTRALAASAQATADQLEKAAKATREIWGKYADDVGLASAKKRLTKEATPELEDALVANVVEADQLTVQFDRQMDELTARLGMERQALAPIDDNLGRMGNKLNEDAEGLGLAARVGEKARSAGGVVSGALGVAELARTAGIDVPLPDPSKLPGVGPLLGLYFKAMGARAAARGVGLIPATKAARAAQTTTTLSDRIGSKARALATGTAAKIARAPATRLAPAQVASRIANIQALDPSEVAATTGTELADTTNAVQAAGISTAERAVSYLQATAPRDPIPARPSWMDPWQPSAQESLDFQRRESSVIDPDGAIDHILTSPSTTLEREALEAVYPAMLQKLRNDLTEQALDLRKNLPSDRLRAIALDLKIPLTVDTAIPGYGSRTPQAQALEPQPSFASPSTPGASPSVNLERVEPRRPRP